MSSLSLTLLGRFHAYHDDQSLPGFRTSKVQALLIYLVTEQQPHNLESIMDLLWPNMPLQVGASQPASGSLLLAGDDF